MPESMNPSLYIEGERGAALAGAVEPGQEMTATVRVRVAAVEGGSVELEVLDFKPDGIDLSGGEQESTGEDAFNSYMAEKTAGQQE